MRWVVVLVLALIAATLALAVHHLGKDAADRRRPAQRAGGSERPGEVELTRFRGVVVDIDGRPIRGVSIHPLGLPRHLDGTAVTSSNRRGRFSLELPAEVTTRVEFGCPGYIREELELLPGETVDSEPEYLLFEGAILRGRVVDEEGRPVPGARVEVSGAHGWSDLRAGDRDGAFELAGPPGPVVIWVHAESHADQLFVDSELRRDEATEVELALARGARVEVRVVGPDGRPVAAACVTVTTEAGDRSATLTDGQGVATVTGLARSLATAVVVRGRFLVHFEKIDLREGDPVRRLAVRLQPAPAWTLVVLDERGDPVSGTWVEIRGHGCELYRGDLRAPDELAVLAPSERYLIELAQPGYPRYRQHLRLADLPDGRLVVRLERGGRLIGRVVDVTGAGVPGARVIITHSDESTRSLFGVDAVTVTSRDGSFRTPLLRPRVHAVQVSHPRSGRVRRTFAIEPSANLDLGELPLAPPGR